MTNLLRADFRRYFTSRYFFLSLAAVAALTVFGHFRSVGNLRALYGLGEPWFFPPSLGNCVLFGTWLSADAPFGIFCAALFIVNELNGSAALFKLSRGATRTAVYISALAVCCCGAVVLRAVSILTEALLLTLTLPGAELLYFSRTEDFFLALLCTLSSAAALAGFAVFLFLSLRKINIYLLIVGLVLSGWLYANSAVPVCDELNEPTHIEATTPEGAPDPNRLTENPDYVSGLRRAAYTVYTDAIPIGQDLQFAENCYYEPPERAARFPLINAGTLALFSAAGVFLLKRMDFH